MQALIEEALSGKIHGFEWAVSKDCLALSCRNLPETGERPTEEEVIQAFAKAGIVAEIERETLENVLADFSPEWTVVAKGIPPIPPTHGRLEYYVDPSQLDGRAAANDSGGVDYKRLNLILNVKKGQELVRKHDPIPGQPGTDVFGKPIPPESGRAVSLLGRPGIELVEDGHLAIAAEDGAIISGRQGMTVSKLFTIPGDVSYKTGNIEFNGSIEVNGTVLSGFELKAEGDILIRSEVEAARIEATGNVTVLGGIHGGGKALIRAGGHVSAKFANDAAIEAGGDVIIRSQLVNCCVRAHGQVHVQETPGAIIGGEIRSGQKIRSKFLGSPGTVKTLAQIGLDSDLQKKISANEEETKGLEAKAADINRILGGLEHLKGQADALPPNQEAVRVKVVREKFTIDGRMKALAKELAPMREDLERALEGTIQVEDTVFGGVTIRIGSDTLPVGHAMRYATFHYVRGEIRVTTQS
jgi:hypothetical protein